MRHSQNSQCKLSSLLSRHPLKTIKILLKHLHSNLYHLLTNLVENLTLKRWKRREKLFNQPARLLITSSMELVRLSAPFIFIMCTMCKTRVISQILLILKLHPYHTIENSLKWSSKLSRCNVDRRRSRCWHHYLMISCDHFECVHLPYFITHLHFIQER